jgi:2-polyprenyl-3-methyl-5-hydroxy-6-metoxy-1,4-benzoquinol methylase
MKHDSIEWLAEWSVEKYQPISKNWFSVGHGTDEEPSQSLLLSTFSSAMKEKYREGMKILDYGCGSGRYANFLSKRIEKFQYIGLEKQGSDQFWGEASIRDGLINAGHDDRVRLGFTESLLEEKAIQECDVVLLLSIFTHTTIEETHRIISKLLPIVDRGGRIIFSMIMNESYQLVGNLYGFQDSYQVTYNTNEQINDIAEKFNVKLTHERDFEANWGYVHSIFSIEKN